jgi:hypothetical protein
MNNAEPSTVTTPCAISQWMIAVAYLTLCYSLWYRDKDKLKLSLGLLIKHHVSKTYEL